jgi:hypothetical protein
VGRTKIPSASRKVAIGLPAELLRRRPDIRSAELNAAAEAARIGPAMQRGSSHRGVFLMSPGLGAMPMANQPYRIWKSCFSPFLYRNRNAIERMFCRLKDFRRIATRYDRLAINFLAGRVWARP